MLTSLLAAIVCWIVAIVFLALAFGSYRQFSIETNKTETGCIISFFSLLIGLAGLIGGIIIVALNAFG